MAPFKIGINMAGAISAGAYTAGVLDFLIQALDEWEAAKQRADAVPRHQVSLEVFSGASAGGMCAAISAVQVQQDFDHISDTTLTGTNNRFYESWVNRIDIRELLQTADLEKGQPVLSLLDSTIIGDIAQYALTPGPVKTRPYISPNLTLFLTLTNLRGIPYSLNGEAPGSLEESTEYYGDRLRFQTVKPGDPAPAPPAKPLPAGSAGQGAWPLLQQAAMATGAFPVFLAPRILTRDAADYTPPMWETAESTPSVPPVQPDWTLKTTDSWRTLNVDGGVIDNDPFDLAHDYLAALNPVPGDGQNPREALLADRAVITVAPFPAQDRFNPGYDPAAQAGVMTAVGTLVSALISQSRFFGESLALIMTGTVFSRFVIAPSDTTLPPRTPALQCGALGAFGGFFERGYRAHDYALGRRNCQQFLRAQFILPQGNPAIAPGLDPEGKALAAFGLNPPNTVVDPQNQRWIPLIPLCGTAAVEVPEPARASMSDTDLDDVVDLIVKRFKAVIPLLLPKLPSIAVHAVDFFVALHEKGELKKYLRTQLP
jgi:predicted acylesterase/phospholipase RssA